MMNPVWSYVLGAIGIAGLWIASTRPKVGWWFNIAAQAVWLTYALVTRQWGFVATAIAYAVVYVRLLRKAYAPRSLPTASTHSRRSRAIGRRRVMTERFDPNDLYVWGPDGEYLEIPLSAEAENTEEQPFIVQWDSSGILRLDTEETT